MSEINTPLSVNSEENTKKSTLILLGSLFTGILFNILFFDKTPGISIPLFTVCFYAFFYLAMRDRMEFRLDITGLLLLVIVLLSSTFALFHNPILMFFNVLAIPVLITAHTILISGKNSCPWHNICFIGDMICEGLVGLLAYMFKPFSLLAGVAAKHKSPQGLMTFGKIAAGIIISIPLAFIVIGLLASADAVFENVMGDITNLFVNVNISTFFVQLVIIVMVTLLTFSYVWNLAAGKRLGITAPKAENKSSVKLDYIITTTVLSVLCAIYFLFISIQFTYLFGSISLRLPAGLTYADYARKGFFELVMVTVINLTVLLVAIHFTKAKGGVEKALQFLETFLVTGTVIILFSAHFRMSLYEKVYGYTYLRFFTHAFMLYLLAMLIAVAVRVWYKKLILAKYLIVISLLAFTMINFVNADKIIASRNTAAYEKNGKIDVRYLSELSYDGIPYMLTVLDVLKTKTPDAKETKLLENHLYFEKKKLMKPMYWQSFNLSASKARKLLAKRTLTYREVPPEYDYMD